VIVDPTTRARAARKQRAANLDPGSKVPTERPEYGDEFAVAVRAILRPRQAEPDVRPETVDTGDRRWDDAVRMADHVSSETPNST
jgi:hypothetical protein